MIMFYVCDTRFENATRLYGIKDTDDGVVEYLPLPELTKYVDNGYKILGLSDLGVFPLNEYQLSSFETFIKLLRKFDAEHNKDGKYRYSPSVNHDARMYRHAGCFQYYYRGGFGGGATEQILTLMEDGNIMYYLKYYSSAVAAQVGGYNGSYSTHSVLYFGDKPDYSKTSMYSRETVFKYYKSVPTFYSQMGD
jgi:hypothetical protein